MKNEKMWSSAGRLVYSLPFLVFGAFHLMQAQNMASLVPGFFPGPGVFWVYITGVVFIVTSLGLALKKYTKWAGKLLAFQLLVFILTIWLPQLGNPELAQIAMPNLLKDTALLGGALLLSAGGCVCKCDNHSCNHCKDCENCEVSV